MNKHYIIGTRGSDLALWQANHVKDVLTQNGISVEIKIIKTQGDKIQNIGFDKMEGKGFFTKELEEALFDKSIDIAVHSCKDLETAMPVGLTLAAYTEREDPRDYLLARKGLLSIAENGWPSINQNITVGTSSIRRKLFLKHWFPAVECQDLRGNVPTRVQKLRENQYDAIVLAGAGLNRLKLDLSDFDVIPLDPEKFVPAPAQGVLGIQIREGEEELFWHLSDYLAHPDTSACAGIERGILRQLGGGCQVALGVYTQWIEQENAWETKAMLAKGNDLKNLHLAHCKTSDPNEAISTILAQLKS
ncbi:MAG: hydroxymethylbilane synthase [Luteibaculaceae bacterium]